MMKLSTMQRLVATLNEDNESPIAEVIASHWNHDSGTVRYFRASANFLFLFKHLAQEYVLRFVHADERTPEAIRAELAYLEHLASQGIRVATPIRPTRGNFIESVATEQGVFHAVVFERLPGEQFEFSDLTPTLAARWGQTLGELHAAAQGYHDSGRATWQDHLGQVAAWLPEEEQSARATLNQLQAQLTQLPIREDNFGLIHFDFELDNLLWRDHQVGVIDFDNSAHYWFAADIAFALREAFDDRAENVNLQERLAHDYIRGYRSAHRIDEEELARVPLFLKWHNLITFAKLHPTLEPGPPQEEPAWAARLRNKLHAKMAFYREAFTQVVQ